MDLTAGKLKVPISALNVFDTLVILIFVPVFDQYVYPFLRSKGYSVNLLTRIGMSRMLFVTGFTLNILLNDRSWLLLCVAKHVRGSRH
jgi:dipeptide/tripeptide permease